MKIQRVLGLVLGFTLVGLTVGAQSKPDFSGTWKFEAAKSDPQMAPPGMQVPPDPAQLVIQQTAAEMTIDNGAAKATFKLDGSDSTNSMNGIPVVTQTAWEGDTIVTRGSIKLPNMTIDFSDTRALSADGRVMTVTHHGKIADMGEATRKLIFTK